MKVYRGVWRCRTPCFPFRLFLGYVEHLGLTCVGVVVEREDDPNIRGDAFKTLFVARLGYDTTEKDLEREFGRFGPIERASGQVLKLVRMLLLTYDYRFGLSLTQRK